MHVDVRSHQDLVSRDAPHMQIMNVDYPLDLSQFTQELLDLDGGRRRLHEILQRLR